jgi:hypothetical protein
LFYAWDVYRLRRAKIATVNLAFRSALESILIELLRRAPEWGYEIRDSAEQLASEWFSDKGVRKLILDLLKQLGLDESAIESEAIRHSIKDLETLDQMLASAEARRNKALRLVAEYRTEFARRLRQATDRVIDGEAVVIEERADQGRARRVQ